MTTTKKMTKFETKLEETAASSVPFCDSNSMSSKQQMAVDANEEDDQAGWIVVRRGSRGGGGDCSKVGRSKVGRGEVGRIIEGRFKAIDGR